MSAPQRFLALACLALAAPVCAAPRNAKPPVQITERPISELAAMLASGRITSQALVEAYRARIAAVDRKGPALHSVIALDPSATEQARAADRRRRAGQALGPLDGIPILLKDNIETAGALPTTAGSLALAANVTGRDAPLVSRLRRAGAIILGKTNLSEWANFRSTRSISGWSAVGGLTKNPYALDRTACGSSSGSAVAVTANLVAAAVGTETNGSLSCPASMNGVVGMKPTVGLISRTYIVPISRTQDSAGPLARSVRDAALLLQAMAGRDPDDPATAAADDHRIALPPAPARLAGVRIGVVRWATGDNPAVARVYERALADLQRAGAILVDVPKPADLDRIGPLEATILTTEAKTAINAYLAAAAPGVSVRSVSGLIAFNEREAGREMPWFGQERLIAAEKSDGMGSAAHEQALANARRIAGPAGIDAMLRAAQATVIVAPTAGPAWTRDPVNGDHYSPVGIGTLAAIAGYPHLTVPMGHVAGLPVGLSFISTAWKDNAVLSVGEAYETASKRRSPPAFSAGISAADQHGALIDGPASR